MNTFKLKLQRLLPAFLVMIMLGSLLSPVQVWADKENNDPVVPSVEDEKASEESNDYEQRGSGTTDTSTDVRMAVEQSIEKTKQYYKNLRPVGTTSHSDYWLFSALWGADVNLKEFPWAENGSPWEKDKFWMKGKDAPTSSSNDDAGIIIGSILLGQDPHKFGKQNIVQDLIGKQNDNGSFPTTIWGEPWAMIALDLVDADDKKEKHLNYILGQQSDTGTFGDVDSNGWILTALAPYMDERPDVKRAIELAVQAVHKGYQATGDISDSWGANSNSTAAALMGLAAVGEDLLSEKWTKDGKNIVEQFIETYQKQNGSFWWQENMAGAVGMATEQSLLALATVAKGESIFVQLKEYKNTNPDRTTLVKVRVEGIDNTLYPEKEIQVNTVNTKATAFDATEQALEEFEIPYKGSSGYFSSIGGEKEATFGGWDGWQYTVNGEYPSVYAGDYSLEDGDEIVWFYGNVGDIYKGWDGVEKVEDLTLRPIISISPQLVEGEEIEIAILANYNVYDKSFQLLESNVETKIKNADVYFGGQTYKTDENGIARIPGEKAKAGSYELKVTKDMKGSYPRLLRQAKKVIIDEKSNPDDGGGGALPSEETVTLSVEKRSIGQGDIIAPKNVALQSGDTAFTLLQRVTLGSIAIDFTGSGATLYIKSIDGLGEFSHGALSGWMYSVNGTFPNYSAGSYQLKDGDTLRWQYTKDLGVDIGGGSVPGGGSPGGGGTSLKPEVQEIPVTPYEPFILDKKFQNDATVPVIVNFGEKKVLPQVTAPRGTTRLEIAQGTKVTSDWDGKLQLPTSLSTSGFDLQQINKILGLSGNKVSKVDFRLKVGGAKTITFDRYVTLTLKGQGDLEAGFIDEKGNFKLIKKSLSANATGNEYAYKSENDLIIKTNHFTEFITFNLAAIDKPIEFTDVADNWAKEFIGKAAQTGIMKGYPDGRFQPNKTVTRAQAASIIVRGLGLTADKSAPFKDISGYAKETQQEIAAAYQHGIVIGKQGKFNPSGEVTRAQLALMLHRAYTQKTGKAYIAKQTAPYPDLGSYDKETVNAISMLYELKIATGSDGKYKPATSTTRGQAAKMFVNFFEHLER